MNNFRDKVKNLLFLFFILTAFLGSTSCGGGGGDASGTNSTPQPSAPLAPQGLTAMAGNEQITITWNEVVDATSYNIYWATTSGVTKSTGTKISNARSPYMHASLANGTNYYYVLTAVNSNGESGESTQVSSTPFAPSNKAPTASFTAPNSAPKGEKVTFDASASNDPEGLIASFSFNFGDGSAVITQTSPIFTHAFTASGTFAVTLNVTDAQGATASITNEITITNEISTGIVLSQPVNVSNTAAWSQGQSFAIDGQGAINVVWEEDGGDILFSRSVDAGKTFSLPKSVMPRQYSSGQMEIVNTANGTILISWTLTGFGSSEILFSRSTDGGRTFSLPVVISTIDNVNSYVPAIATDGVNGIGIVWMDNSIDPENIDAIEGIFYGRSTDNGNSFYSPKLLQRQTSTSANISCPDIAISSQNIYVAWPQGPFGLGDIYFSRSVDGGTTFSLPINISSFPEKSWCPHISLDSAGNVYLVWEEGSALDKNRKILFSKSADKGLSFNSPAIISPSFLDSFCSNIAVSDTGTVFITWSNGDSYNKTFQSFLVYSSDGGKSFSIPLKIPVIASEDGCPRIVAKGLNQIHLVWNGPIRLPNPNTVYVKPDIFYSSGTVSIP